MTRHLPSVMSYAENRNSSFNGNLSRGPEFVQADNKLMGALQHSK